MNPHDLIELLAGVVIMGAGWQLKKLSEVVSKLEIMMAKCVDYETFGVKLGSIHEKINSVDRDTHGRLQVLETRSNP